MKDDEVGFKYAAVPLAPAALVWQAELQPLPYEEQVIMGGDARPFTQREIEAMQRAERAAVLKIATDARRSRGSWKRAALLLAREVYHSQ